MKNKMLIVVAVLLLITAVFFKLGLFVDVNGVESWIGAFVLTATAIGILIFRFWMGKRYK